MMVEPQVKRPAHGLSRSVACARGLAFVCMAAVLSLASVRKAEAQAIATLRPDGPGVSAENARSGCASNWECVDEATADDLTSYVFSAVNSLLTDSYSLENSSETGAINSVTVSVRSSCVGSPPACRMRTLLHTYGSDFIGANESPDATWATYSTTYATNPSTGNPWTWAEVDALEAGAQLRGHAAQGVEARVTQLWVDVDVGTPQMDIAKSVSPAGTPTPATDLTYTLMITNIGAADAVDVTVIDSLASELDFKVGSVVNSLPPGITVTVEYSDDGGSTWIYSPASGGCGASAGYDSCVTHIRWILENDLTSTPPDNTGDVQFIARVR